MKKTWIQKRDSDKKGQVKILNKKFADMPEGCRMFIATPKIIETYLRLIPLGTSVELSTMRKDLALSKDAEMTCPVTTGIFLRVVSEAALEELALGKTIDEVTPFWRVVKAESKLADKLNCDISFIHEQRALEGL